MTEGDLLASLAEAPQACKVRGLCLAACAGALQSVPRWRARSCLIGCCCALVALVVGLVVGLVVDRMHLVDTDKIVNMVPFFPHPDAPLNFLVVGDWGRDGDFNQSWNAQSVSAPPFNLLPPLPGALHITLQSLLVYHRGCIVVHVSVNTDMDAMQSVCGSPFSSTLRSCWGHPTLRSSHCCATLLCSSEAAMRRTTQRSCTPP